MDLHQHLLSFDINESSHEWGNTYDNCEIDGFWRLLYVISFLFKCIFITYNDTWMQWGTNVWILAKCVSNVFLFFTACSANLLSSWDKESQHSGMMYRYLWDVCRHWFRPLMQGREKWTPVNLKMCCSKQTNETINETLLWNIDVRNHISNAQ